jgi:hypothetical protein
MPQACARVACVACALSVFASPASISRDRTSPRRVPAALLSPQADRTAVYVLRRKEAHQQR